MVNFKYFFIIFSFLFLSTHLYGADPVVDPSQPTNSTTPTTNTTTNNSNPTVASTTNSKTNSQNNSNTSTTNSTNSGSNSQVMPAANSKNKASSNNNKTSSSNDSKTPDKAAKKQTNNTTPVAGTKDNNSPQDPDQATNDEAQKAAEATQQAQLNAEEQARKTKEETALRKQEKVALEEVMKIVSDDYGFLEEVPADDGNILNLTQGNDNYAILYTDNGNIVIELYPDVAPKTVRAFKALVRAGFYNGTEFFKILPDYLAQAGDPTSSGYGGTGKKRDAEISDKTFERGTIAMSNQNNLHSDDSQFFITFNSFPWLDKKYTIFGKVISGMPILENLPASYKNDGISDDPLTINRALIASDVAKAAVENEKEKSDTTGLQNKIPDTNTSQSNPSNADVGTAAATGTNASKGTTTSQSNGQTTTANNTPQNAPNTSGTTANPQSNGQAITPSNTANASKTLQNTPNTSGSTANAQSSATSSSNTASNTAVTPSVAPKQTPNSSTSLYGPSSNGSVPPIELTPRDNSTSLYGNLGK